jgi:ABC-2 type transport system ATP-binding protein
MAVAGSTNEENEMDEIAVQVRDAYKAFSQKKSWWPWQTMKNGNSANAAGNGAGMDTNGNNGQGQKSSGATTIAVDHLSFDIYQGEIFGVLGPNGSGKSTLIRLIATLLSPDGGRITVFGHDVVKEAMAAQRLINRVSVETAFFKKLSPMENLLYGARLDGVDSAQIRRKVASILKRLEIPEKDVHRPMEEMSRGMQQKIAIARALLRSPSLLLLDEPTTGLDPRSKREVQSFVRELRDRHNTTILLSTHDMVEAEKLCDRIAIMDSGRIVAMDTPDRLKALSPRSNGHELTLEDVFLNLTGKQLAPEAEG